MNNKKEWIFAVAIIVALVSFYTVRNYSEKSSNSTAAEKAVQGKPDPMSQHKAERSIKRNSSLNLTGAEDLMRHCEEFINLHGFPSKDKQFEYEILGRRLFRLNHKLVIDGLKQLEQNKSNHHLYCINEIWSGFLKSFPEPEDAFALLIALRDRQAFHLLCEKVFKDMSEKDLEISWKLARSDEIGPMSPDFRNPAYKARLSVLREMCKTEPLKAVNEAGIISQRAKKEIINSWLNDYTPDFHELQETLKKDRNGIFKNVDFTHHVLNNYPDMAVEYFESNMTSEGFNKFVYENFKRVYELNPKLACEYFQGYDDKQISLIAPAVHQGKDKAEVFKRVSQISDPGTKNMTIQRMIQSDLGNLVNESDIKRNELESISLKVGHAKNMQDLQQVLRLPELETIRNEYSIFFN